jgi:hypothetical protein
VAAGFALQLVLFQLAEEIGFTGFSSIIGRTGITREAHPACRTAVGGMACAGAFRRRGWGVEALISAPIIFAIEFV